jgi:PAS domain S-box-containing protein
MSSSPSDYPGLSEAIALSPTAAVAITGSGRVLAANSLACAILGYSADELVAMHVSEICACPPEEVRDLVKEMRESGELVDRAPIRRKDGLVLEVDYVAGLSLFEGRKVYIAVLYAVSPGDSPVDRAPQ